MNIPPLTPPIVSTAVRPLANEASTPGLRDEFVSEARSISPAQNGQSLAQSQPESNREEIGKAIQQVNDFLKPINNSIQFNLDDETGITVVKVVDLATQEVIRQIPSEEMLAISQAIDTMKGLLIKQKA